MSTCGEDFMEDHLCRDTSPWGDGRVSFLKDLGISSLLPIPANDNGLSSLPSTIPAAAAPETGSSSTSPVPSNPLQPVKCIAMEMEDCCPICLGNWKEVSYVMPCHHQFCYQCILRWAETKPECPLCKRRIQSILHSVQADDDYRVHKSQNTHKPEIVCMHRNRARSL
uniref:E3 ubiquitin-protein ligase Topors n=1 Tax=Melopsittacus undulatus TaxID=13146 RepID=A0A8V5GMX3_MELUD